MDSMLTTFHIQLVGSCDSFSKITTTKFPLHIYFYHMIFATSPLETKLNPGWSKVLHISKRILKQSPEISKVGQKDPWLWPGSPGTLLLGEACCIRCSTTSSQQVVSTRLRLLFSIRRHKGEQIQLGSLLIS